MVGDNVMLSMATSDHLSGPIKLLFPRSELSLFQEGGNYPFELLGLGDVALPGLLACLALRYDASRQAAEPRAVHHYLPPLCLCGQAICIMAVQCLRYICLSLCLSIYVCLCVSLFLFLSVSLPLSLSLSLSLYVCVCVCVCVCLPLSLSLSLSNICTGHHVVYHDAALQ